MSHPSTLAIKVHQRTHHRPDVQASAKVSEQLLIILLVQGAHPSVPVREVEGEVLGGVAVVHVMVLHCIEPLAALQPY